MPRRVLLSVSVFVRISSVFLVDCLKPDRTLRPSTAAFCFSSHCPPVFCISKKDEFFVNIPPFFRCAFI